MNFKGNLFMENLCKRGNWTFQFDKPFVYDFSDKMSHDMQAVFWAQKRDDIRVSRSMVLNGYTSYFTYRGPNFMIQYHISSVLDLEQLDKEDFEKIISEHPILPAHYIWINDTFSWVDYMTQAEFDELYSDLQDPCLYQCLFDCIPESWYSPPKPYWPRERLYRPIENLVIDSSLGVDNFQFLRDMIATSKWATKQQLIDRTKQANEGYKARFVSNISK